MSKIMFIHHSGAIGGAGVSLCNNVALLSHHNDVVVYVPSDPDMISRLIREQCYNVDVVEYGRRIGAITAYSGGDSVYSFRFLYRASLIIKQFVYWNREIKKQNPDVVVLNSKILCWMSMLPSLKRTKSVLFVRETMQGKSSRNINKIIRGFLERINTVVFLCDYDRKQEKLCKARTAVINNSLNDNQMGREILKQDAMNELHLDKKKFQVLYVGGVSEMKGFDLVVKAILQLGSNYELTVAGNNFENAMDSKSAKVREYARYWKSFLKQNDSLNQIHIIGRQTDMTACYSACDILVFPMRSMHQARPVFEAGYYGKPVIITDFKNIQEFVIDGENGLAVELDSVQELAEKIDYLFRNPSECKRMGAINRKMTFQNHDANQNYEKLKKVIEGTIIG